MDFINEEMGEAFVCHILCQRQQGVIGEIQVFSRDIQSGVTVEVLFDMLEDEGCLSHAARTSQTHKMVLPIYFSVQVAMKICLGSIYQQVVISEQFFHDETSLILRQR